MCRTKEYLQRIPRRLESPTHTGAHASTWIQDARIREVRPAGWHFRQPCCTEIGTLLDGRNVLRAFKSLARRAGVDDAAVHRLRHTCASLLLAQGVDPREIMETLGHSAYSITMDLYAHVMPQKQRETADRMNTALRW